MSWNIRRLIGWAYAAVVVVFLLAISAAFRSNDIGGERLVSRIVTEVQPESEYMDSQEWNCYVFNLQDVRQYGNTMMIHTTHWEVEELLDGKLVYQSLRSGSIFGKTTGEQIHLLDIPEDAETMVIRTRSIYPGAKKNHVKFLAGDRKRLIIHSFRSGVPVLLAGIAIVYIGIYLLLDWFVRMRRISSGRYALYFGIFSTALGLWTINESGALVLLVTNRVASNFMAHLLLMSTVYPFVMFVRAYFDLEKDRILTLIGGVSVIHMLIRLILQLTDVAALKNTLVYTHILIVAAFAYMLYVVVYKAITGEKSHSVRMAAIGFGIMAAGILATMVIMYLFHEDIFLIPAMCFMLYCMVMWNGISKENMRQLELAHKAESYKHMAETDNLTGISNRNAYERNRKKIRLQPGTCVATFDLNRLKQTNDELGHAAGDQMIRSAANMLRETFGQQGRCFRIGGDEFCVILEDTTEAEVQAQMRELHALEEKSNQEVTGGYSIYLAKGYAFYEDGDHSLEDIRARADQKMYADKAASKQTTPERPLERPPERPLGTEL